LSLKVPQKKDNRPIFGDEKKRGGRTSSQRENKKKGISLGTSSPGGGKKREALRAHAKSKRSTIKSHHRGGKDSGGKYIRLFQKEKGALHRRGEAIEIFFVLAHSPKEEGGETAGLFV